LPNVHQLKYHYRNGQRICHIADELAKPWGGFEPLRPTCNYDEKRLPSSVSVETCADLSAQVAHTITNLERQIKAYPDEYLGVLCPSRVGLKTVSKLMLESRIGSQCIEPSLENRG
jgi:hypothetical protein